MNEGYLNWIQDHLNIVNKEGELVPFRLNDIQLKFLTEDMTGRDIVLKARQQGFCLDPETPILMADLTWRALKDVEVGEELVSTDEDARGGRGRGRQMNTGIVEAKRTVHENAYKIVLESGESLIATGNHRFLTHTAGTKVIGWRKVKYYKAGYKIRYIARHWSEKRTLEDAWMGGIIDGEAHFRIKKSGGVELSIHQIDGLVWQKVVAYAEKHGFAYRVDWDYRGHRAKKPVGSITFNRLGEMFELLGRTRPLRHIDKHWWDNKSFPGKRNGLAWDTVVSIEPLGVRKMIDLQTTTKTFIANGYVSHNSSLILATFTADFLMKENTYNVVVADDTDNAQGLLKRVKDYVGYWCEKKGVTEKDILKYNSKYELYFEGMNSTYHIGTAQNTQFGRSRTITNLHLSEVAFYPHMQEILAGAMQAVVPSGRVILETTANGFNYFHDYWESAKRNETSFMPHFYKASDFYDKEFLEMKRKELKSASDGGTYEQEYPENDMEAFLLSGNPYFSPEAIQHYQDSIIKPIYEGSDYVSSV